MQSCFESVVISVFAGVLVVPLQALYHCRWNRLMYLLNKHHLKGTVYNLVRTRGVPGVLLDLTI